MEFSRPEGALSADPTIWLYTSLSSGSSTVVTATSRLEGILKANRIPFKALDVATEEKARMLWGRRAGERKLPGLVKQGMVLADLAEVEEWNEYGEVRENLLDKDEATASPALASLSKPAAPAAASIPARPAAPTPATAATHNAVAAPPPSTPSAAAIKAAASTSSLKSTKSTATTASADSSKTADSTRKENMMSLAEQVAARAKKSSGLRTTSGQLLTKSGNTGSAKAATESATKDVEEKPEAKTEKTESGAAGDADGITSAAALDKVKTPAATTVPAEAAKETESSTNEPAVEVVSVKEQMKEAHDAAKAKNAVGEAASQKPIEEQEPSTTGEESKSSVAPKTADAPASKVVSTNEGEQDPPKQGAVPTAAVKKESSDKDGDTDESDETKGEDDGNVEKHQTQEQDPTVIENGMMELEIAMMLNSPTMGSVRERKKQRADGQPGSPDTMNSTLGEDDDIPGFHSPVMRSGGASPLSSMSPMSGFGFNNVDDNRNREKAQKRDVSGSTADTHPQQSSDPSSSTRQLRDPVSTTTDGSTNEKPITRIPSLRDDEEEVSAGCCGGLFGGGKKKKKQNTS